MEAGRASVAVPEIKNVQAPAIHLVNESPDREHLRNIVSGPDVSTGYLWRQNGQLSARAEQSTYSPSVSLEFGGLEAREQ